MSLKSMNFLCTDLPDSWYTCIYNILEHGREFTIDRGSYEGQKRLEFDWITLHIKNPQHHPLLPSIPSQYNIPNPVDDDYLADYVPYLMTGELKKGESYTYGSRLCNGNPDVLRAVKNNYLKDYSQLWDTEKYGDLINLNQIEMIIWVYKNKGHRNNQMVLQIAQSSDILLKDPPCLRHIDTRIQDGKLHFYPYFRSWDLWGGFSANLAAIQMLKEYMAGEIGVEDGEIIASSKGLHLYNYVWELAEAIRGKTIKEFRNG